MEWLKKDLLLLPLLERKKMTKQEIIDKLTKESKIFLNIRLLNPHTGSRSNACYGVEFGLVDMDLLREACHKFRENLPKGIDLFMTDGHVAFEIKNKAHWRISSIVYLANINDFSFS